MENIRIGARLRAARKAAGFKTSKAFLKKYKVPASTYSQHESGARTPDDETLNFYSKVLDVNYNWLKNGSGNPFTKLSNDKKRVMEEELIDLSTMKEIKNKTSDVLDQKLLAEIIEKIFTFHREINSNLSISKIAKDAILMYVNITKEINNHTKRLAAVKSALAIYRKNNKPI